MRAGEHVKAAPVDTGFKQAVNQHRHALGIDAERAWPASDADSAVLDRERRGHADRNLRLNAYIFARANSAGGFALAFDADRRLRLDRGLELDIQLAGSGKVDRDTCEPRRLQPLQFAQRNHAKAVDISSKEF